MSGQDRGAYEAMSSASRPVEALGVGREDDFHTGPDEKRMMRLPSAHTRRTVKTRVAEPSAQDHGERRDAGVAGLRQ